MIPQPPPPPQQQQQPWLNAFGKSNLKRIEQKEDMLRRAMLGQNPSGVSITTNPRKLLDFSELYPKLNPKPQKPLSELYRTK